MNEEQTEHGEQAQCGEQSVIPAAGESSVVVETLKTEFLSQPKPKRIYAES